MQLLLAATLISFVIFWLMSEVEIRELASTRTWRALRSNWFDLGIIGLLAWAWFAAGSARAYALSRLATIVLERRNWCVRRSDTDDTQLVDTGFNACGRVTVGEGAGFAISTLVPTIVLLSLHNFGAPIAVVWTMLSAAVAYAVSEMLRLHENRVDLEQCYGAPPAKQSASASPA
jgi:hypothetical protein